MNTYGNTITDNNQCTHCPLPAFLVCHFAIYSIHVPLSLYKGAWMEKIP